MSFLDKVMNRTPNSENPEEGSEVDVDDRKIPAPRSVKSSSKSFSVGDRVKVFQGSRPLLGRVVEELGADDYLVEVKLGGLAGTRRVEKSSDELFNPDSKLRIGRK